MVFTTTPCEAAQLCVTLCDPTDCGLPRSAVHGIFQARILEWVAISFSKGSSQPRDQIRVSRIVGRCFTIWGREVLVDFHHAIEPSWRNHVHHHSAWLGTVLAQLIAFPPLLLKASRTLLFLLTLLHHWPVSLLCWFPLFYPIFESWTAQGPSPHTSFLYLHSSHRWSHPILWL